jgi:hypothetical protein
MKRTGLAALLLARAVAAADLPPDFRTEFEKVFPPNQAYAVVMAEGIPTLTVGGAQGSAFFKFHYAIDVVNGQWYASKPFVKVDQAQEPNDALLKGEVMKLQSVAYKKDRVELHLVSLDKHSVSRDKGYRDLRHELVSTKFKFFFPFHVMGAADLPKALDYVAVYLKPFPNEAAARAFGRELAGDAPPPSLAGPGNAPAAGKSKEAQVGMTPLEVLEALGKPERETVSGRTLRWMYSKVTVVFEDSRVKEIKPKE